MTAFGHEDVEAEARQAAEAEKEKVEDERKRAQGVIEKFERDFLKDNDRNWEVAKGDNRKKTEKATEHKGLFDAFLKGDLSKDDFLLKFKEQKRNGISGAIDKYRSAKKEIGDSVVKESVPVPIVEVAQVTDDVRKEEKLEVDPLEGIEEKERELLLDLVREERFWKDTTINKRIEIVRRVLNILKDGGELQRRRQHPEIHSKHLDDFINKAREAAQKLAEGKGDGSKQEAEPLSPEKQVVDEILKGEYWITKTDVSPEARAMDVRALIDILRRGKDLKEFGRPRGASPDKNKIRAFKKALGVAARKLGKIKSDETAEAGEARDKNVVANSMLERLVFDGDCWLYSAKAKKGNDRDIKEAEEKRRKAAEDYYNALRRGEKPETPEGVPQGGEKFIAFHQSAKAIADRLGPIEKKEEDVSQIDRVEDDVTNDADSAPAVSTSLARVVDDSKVDEQTSLARVVDSSSAPDEDIASNAGDSTLDTKIETLDRVDSKTSTGSEKAEEPRVDKVDDVKAEAKDDGNQEILKELARVSKELAEYREWVIKDDNGIWNKKSARLGEGEQPIPRVFLLDDLIARRRGADDPEVKQAGCVNPELLRGFVSDIRELMREKEELEAKLRGESKPRKKIEVIFHGKNKGEVNVRSKGDILDAKHSKGVDVLEEPKSEIEKLREMEEVQIDLMIANPDFWKDGVDDGEKLRIINLLKDGFIELDDDEVKKTVQDGKINFFSADIAQLRLYVARKRKILTPDRPSSPQPLDLDAEWQSTKDELADEDAQKTVYKPDAYLSDYAAAIHDEPPVLAGSERGRRLTRGSAMMTDSGGHEVEGLRSYESLQSAEEEYLVLFEAVLIDKDIWLDLTPEAELSPRERRDALISIVHARKRVSDFEQYLNVPAGVSKLSSAVDKLQMLRGAVVDKIRRDGVQRDAESEPFTEENTVDNVPVGPYEVPLPTEVSKVLRSDFSYPKGYEPPKTEAKNRSNGPRYRVNMLPVEKRERKPKSVWERVTGWFGKKAEAVKFEAVGAYEDVTTRAFYKDVGDRIGSYIKGEVSENESKGHELAARWKAVQMALDVASSFARVRVFPEALRVVFTEMEFNKLQKAIENPVIENSDTKTPEQILEDHKQKVAEVIRLSRSMTDAKKVEVIAHIERILTKAHEARAVAKVMENHEEEIAKVEVNSKRETAMVLDEAIQRMAKRNVLKREALNTTMALVPGLGLTGRFVRTFGFAAIRSLERRDKYVQEKVIAGEEVSKSAILKVFFTQGFSEFVRQASWGSSKMDKARAAATVAKYAGLMIGVDDIARLIPGGTEFLEEHVPWMKVDHTYATSGATEIATGVPSPHTDVPETVTDGVTKTDAIVPPAPVDAMNMSPEPQDTKGVTLNEGSDVLETAPSDAVPEALAPSEFATPYVIQAAEIHKGDGAVEVLSKGIKQMDEATFAKMGYKGSFEDESAKSAFALKEAMKIAKADGLASKWLTTESRGTSLIPVERDGEFHAAFVHADGTLVNDQAEVEKLIEAPRVARVSVPSVVEAPPAEVPAAEPVETPPPGQWGDQADFQRDENGNLYRVDAEGDKEIINRAEESLPRADRIDKVVQEREEKETKAVEYASSVDKVTIKDELYSELETQKINNFFNAQQREIQQISVLRKAVRDQLGPEATIAQKRLLGRLSMYAVKRSDDLKQNIDLLEDSNTKVDIPKKVMEHELWTDKEILEETITDIEDKKNGINIPPASKEAWEAVKKAQRVKYK